MCDSTESRLWERINPFIKDLNESVADDICATYNASFGLSEGLNVDPEYAPSNFGTNICNDYFNEPLIHVDSTSSPTELEEAIFRLKHMVLASINDSDERRHRLFDRLVDLRHLLHIMKESPSAQNVVTEDDESESLHLSPCTEPDSHTPLVRRVRSTSHLSLPHSMRKTGSQLSGYFESSSRSSCGHELKLTLSIFHLGQFCECCCRMIRDPSRRVFACSQCPVICHPQDCVRALTRRCPRGLLCSDPYSSLKRLSHKKTTDRNLLQPTDFRHLEVRRLCYLGANLTHQSWSCFECRKPLRPAPNNTVTAEPSGMIPFTKCTIPVMETTADLLMRQAAQIEVNSDMMLNWVTPQLKTQVSSLWNHKADLLSQDPKITVPTHDESQHLRWAYAESQTDLGPIQTWADAVVLESVHRMPRISAIYPSTTVPATQSPIPHLRNGEITNSTVLSPTTSAYTPTTASQKFDQARICHYTGRFYCTQCHWGDSHVVPACVFKLGDYRPKPVCRSAFLFLTYAWSRQLFRVPDSWYQYEPNANAVAALRFRLFRFKPYVNSCDQARIIWTQFNSQEPYWIVEQPYTFTMELVDNTVNGTLATKLQNFLQLLDKHVQSCSTCNASIPPCCPVCRTGPIRSYDPLATFCSDCRRPCHRKCLACPLPVSLDADSASNVSKNTIENLSDTYIPTDAQLVEVLYPALRTVCLSCSQRTK